MSEWITIVLLGAVIFLYAFTRSKGTDEQPEQPSHVLKDVEASFEQFSDEINDQYDKLIEKVKQWKSDQQSEFTQLQDQIQHLNERLQMVERDYEQLKNTVDHLAVKSSEISSNQGFQSAADMTPGTEHASEAQSPPTIGLRERYPSVFALYDQGKSSDYIAKKTNMNKGEVQLIIQLAEQEEAGHA